MHRECFQAIKSLRTNSDIIITKPDKGSGVVTLDKSDYVLKMGKILDDNKKFQRIGPCDANATTQQKLKANSKDDYYNYTTTMNYRNPSTRLFVPLARKDRGSMDYQKLTNRTFLFDLFYP